MSAEKYLDAIEARLKAATMTDWPWSRTIKQVFTWALRNPARSAIPGHPVEFIAEAEREADAEFISNAPQDIKALLRVVRALVEGRRKRPGVFGEWSVLSDLWVVHLEEALAALDEQTTE